VSQPSLGLARHGGYPKFWLSTAFVRVFNFVMPFFVRPIHAGMVCCHLLHDGREGVLIDAGFWGQQRQIQRAVENAGLGPDDIRAILLTHGHLDHVVNLAWLKEWTRAPVYAHPAEQIHIDGRFSYSGAARWCGRLEALGRKVFRYRPATIDVPLRDGQELPFWGGLRVVHLPGHTLGHCGFFSERLRLLFPGDLFTSSFLRGHLPPPIFNAAPELIPASFEKAHQLNAELMLPNHYLGLDGALHRQRFERLYSRLKNKRGASVV
jgi:glyoxylase-like metal-dependent hydrolase (beta-lactamase superfamily II)